MKMTRRGLTRLAALSAVPLPQIKAQPPVPPNDRPSAAHRQFHEAARQLASVKLARTVEPAFRFEAYP